MRARSREVQIFNMSLIDILCGALGAFCFMMLVLLPYYKPPGSASDLHQEQVQTDELMKEMDKLRQAQAANDPAFAQQMSDTMHKLEDQLKQMQGEMNQMSAQNQQMQTQSDELQKKNQEQKRQLDARNPFFVYVAADDQGQAIDLYVQDDLVQGEKRNPPFNPIGAHQGHFWSGDIDLVVPGRSVALWAVRDSPANLHYKIYVKLANQAAQRRATGIFAAVYGANYSLNLPNLALNAERYWTLAGTLSTDPQGTGTVTFQQATDAERDAEWKKLSNGAAPPPPATAPNAAANSAPGQNPSGGMAPADRKALLERMMKEQQQRQQHQQQQSQGASPPPSP